MRLTRKFGLAYSSPKLLVQEVFGLLLSAILFKIKRRLRKNKYNCKSCKSVSHEENDLNFVWYLCVTEKQIHKLSVSFDITNIYNVKTFLIL